MPVMDAKKVEIKIGIKISAGLAAPSWVLYTIILTGIIVIPAALIT